MRGILFKNLKRADFRAISCTFIAVILTFSGNLGAQGILEFKKNRKPKSIGTLTVSNFKPYSRERLISEWLTEYEAYTAILENDHESNNISKKFVLDKAGNPVKYPEGNGLQFGTNFVGAYDKRLMDILMLQVAASVKDGEAGSGMINDTRTFTPINNVLGLAFGFSDGDKGTPNTNSTIFNRRGTEFFADPGNNKNHLHFVDQLHDYEAARNATIGIRRKHMLDDTHDHWGGILQHLSFDISLIPQQGVDRLAQLEVEVVDLVQDGPMEPGFSERFESGLRRIILEETLLLQSRLHDIDFFPTNYGEVSNALLSVKVQTTRPGEEKGGFGLLNAEGTQVLPEPVRDGLQQILTNKFSTTEDSFKYLEGYMKTRYSELADFLSIEPNSFDPGTFKTPSETELNSLDSRLNQFWTTLIANNPRLRQRVSVLAVEPSEHAQNVSGVAAFEQIRSTAALFSGGFGNGFGAQGEMARYMRSQTMIEAITRRPLALGYVDARPGNRNSSVSEGKNVIYAQSDPSCCCPEKFGWYLGPRFKIEDVRKGLVGRRRELRVGWDHTEAKHHLAVTLVTPALTKSIKLRFKLRWVDPKTGKIDDCLPFICKDRTIELTPDFRPFFNGILQKKEGTPKQPLLSTLSTAEIRPQEQVDKKTTTAENTVTVEKPRALPTTLYVHGLDLWRSPEVFLGNVKAKSVKIGHDMKGLTATFEQFPDPYDGFADLIVVTSTGRDVLHNAVRILGDSDDDRGRRLL